MPGTQYCCAIFIVGGDGMVGTVLDIRGWDNESGRSVANVTWSSGMTNVYRLGHKGKVDIKYTEAAEGGFYFRDHLPILGKLQSLFHHSSTLCYSHSLSFYFILHLHLDNYEVTTAPSPFILSTVYLCPCLFIPETCFPHFHRDAYSEVIMSPYLVELYCVVTNNLVV